MHPFRSLPWGWLITIVGIYGGLSWGLIQLKVPFLWLMPIAFFTAIYSAISKTTWLVIFSWLWWFIFSLSIVEFLLSLLLLIRVPAPVPHDWWLGYIDFFVAFAIFAVAKFLAVLLLPITQRFCFYLRTTLGISPYHYLIWLLPPLMSAFIGFQLIQYWQVDLDKTLYTLVFFLFYITLQIAAFASIIIPPFRAGTLLKQNIQSLQTSLILLAAAGLGMGVGWLLTLT